MKKVKVGVIGIGYLGKFHAEKYAGLPDAELVGVVDTDKQRADELASALRTKAFYSYHDILSKEKVDAVSIVVPTSLHHKIAKDFLSEGIDVLLEKPITNTLREADDLIREAGAKKAILQIGHLERFNAAVIAAGGMIDNPLYLECHRLSPFPNRSTDVDVVLDVMIHDIDIVLDIVRSEIESIDASGIPVLTQMADIANARIKFKNGCVANITAGRVSHERVRKLVICQKGGYISVDYAAQSAALFRNDSGRMVEQILNREKNDTLLEEIKAFINSVITRRPPAVSGEDGRRALEVAQRIQEGITGA